MTNSLRQFVKNVRDPKKNDDPEDTEKPLLKRLRALVSLGGEDDE